MRNTVINSIHQAAKKNKDIVFLTGDLGYSVIEKFVEELTEQIYNTGIAEQNMMGVAAGLALAGKKVFVYSIVPFVTKRCFEQIRLDVCYQNVDVTIIGVGGGYAYGTLGTTHYGLEDIALMRPLPNMKVVVPADPHEAGALIEQIIQDRGPYYLRLNRGGEQNITDTTVVPQLGQGNIVRHGTKLTIFTVGAITTVALQAAEAVKEDGLDVEVIHFHTVKPLDTALILDRLQTRQALITLEEHMVIGGLGSAVAEVVAEVGSAAPLRRLGVHGYLKGVGKQDYLREAAGIGVNDVISTLRSLWKK